MIIDPWFLGELRKWNTIGSQETPAAEVVLGKPGGHFRQAAPGKLFVVTLWGIQHRGREQVLVGRRVAWGDICKQYRIIHEGIGISIEEYLAPCIKLLITGKIEANTSHRFNWQGYTGQFC